MKTIVIVAGIILAGATVIAVVQKDKKKDAAPEVHQAGDVHGIPAGPSSLPANTSGLNPAHGLAGHRCDLPVGAPLSSGSGTAASAQGPTNININQVPQQPIAAPASTTVPTATGVKVNPAHGLPGHRCDLQVGAPLTSASGGAKPGQATQSVNINPKPSPAASASTPAAGVKVNPAHGLPGHRCDLQVGAPLT